MPALAIRRLLAYRLRMLTRLARIAPMAVLSTAALWSVSADAAELREFCPDRPGLGTPACTLDAGRVAVELGLGDWTRDRTGDQRVDTVTAGKLLLRAGLSDDLEVQLGWTAFGHVRTRDRATGGVARASGVGDVTVAVRQNVQNPDGSGLSIAIMPYVGLPTGNRAIGAGDWGAGVLLPIGLALSDRIALGLTPTIDAVVDSDGDGRHAGYGAVAGVGWSATDRLSLTGEVSVYRDRDPSGHSTEALAGLSAGWRHDDATQFDLGVNLGLNRTSADAQVYVGVARRF